MIEPRPETQGLLGTMCPVNVYDEFAEVSINIDVYNALC